MSELQEIYEDLKTLFELQKEIQNDLNKIPKEYIDIVSKSKLIEDRISELLQKFHSLVDEDDQ